MKSKGIAIPYVVWMAIFVVAPLILVVVYAITNRDGSLTAENFASMTQYASVFGRSFLLAFVATVVCILLGYPMAYFLARERGRLRQMATMLIMLPMWMNFLLRTYSWMAILENNGLLNQLFRKIGVIALYNSIFGTDISFFRMINTQGAVVLGMVYNFLPFMVLPLYNALTKIDPNVINAAHDLGANWFQAFLRVIFPLSLPGVISGITMVFVPALTTFVISNLLGGSKILLIGNVIEQEFTQASNWHLGSGLSIVLMVFILMTAIFDKNGEGTSL